MGILKRAMEKKKAGADLTRDEKKAIRQSEKHARWRSENLLALLKELSSQGDLAATIGDRYVVTSSGKVFGANGKGCKQLKPGTKPGGYKFVGMRVKEKFTYKMVHRLVAEAFIPNPENKPQVNHIDGNKENNRAENLEWVTPKENQAHAGKYGLLSHGSSHWRAKITEDDVMAIRSAEGTCQEVGDTFGLCKQSVSNIRRRKGWKHV